MLEFARELPIADGDRHGLDCLQSRRELNGPEISEKLAQVVGRPVARARSDAAFGTFRYTKVAAGDEGHVHVDGVEADATVIVYLSPNPASDSGTAIFVGWSIDEILAASDISVGDAAVFIQERFNRAVVFPGGRVPHCRVGGSADDKSGQRITQVFFVSLEEHASAEH